MPTKTVIHYKSTRSSSLTSTFANALTSGYAQDGGLFVPNVIPQFSAAELEEMKGMSFDELAYAVLRPFVPSNEIGDDDFKSIIASSFSLFHSENRVELSQPGGAEGIQISELFHGPTFCFKDFGLQLLTQFISYFTKGEEKRTLILSTTGDTGPAALAGVKHCANPNLNAMCFYPAGQISDFQRRQMTCLLSSPNIVVVEFEGSGDDMDAPIKNLQSDKEFMQKTGLAGVNSYNIGRPLSQMVHYFWTIFRALENPTNVANKVSKLNIVIPTGAMGNITACYLSKLSGLPINSIAAATNLNDVTYRTFNFGDLSRNPTMHMTLSDAINIQIPYNMERILYYKSGGDEVRVKKWMEGVYDDGKIRVEDEFVDIIKEEFKSERVTDEELKDTMKKYKDNYEYYADPHTCVAIKCAEKIGWVGADTCVMSTASPCKFEESVVKCLGEEGWKDYYENVCPSYSKSVPSGSTSDKFEKIGNLEESQKVWEERTRHIILSRFFTVEE
ncbi:hypothetical protein TrLO_g14936 [Triparma laevis f. longispina]|uniref:Threonine synthase N-terminal domain-containing protein n=1 Tax=Triparma laevis f. longispina TaxID=1714387 RepID=A0A9W7FP25_9STRA|nr:hypothetical protein TrLO_g14936 [Triparma laevis f. longispina]